MLSLERKEFNKAVRELDELHFDFYSKLEAAIVAILKVQPQNKITFTPPHPQIVQDISNQNVTLATISSLWLDGETIMANISFKDGKVLLNETISLWGSNLCDLYHTYTGLAEAIKKALKEKE
ncbi:MAG: hypothetical protein IK013_08470 [Bacteroidales bacterium]|nr:hypothetical protein [Bacteroidales bacterium]